MARPSSPLLSREKIGRAAIGMIDDGGELKIQPLAKELGVSLSSIYHHVDGREGVIHAMREVLSAEYALNIPDQGSWKEDLKAKMDSLWRLYSDHPRVMIHLLGVTVEEPRTLTLYESLIDVLVSAGVPETELLTTIEVLDAFAFGAALDALSPQVIFSPESEDSRLTKLIENHPAGAERNHLLYRRGLDFIIAGIEAGIPQSQPLTARTRSNR
ncbi:DNA-binding transcriptional regulator, AcrR family [Brevibacterium siliguriense]|uniref:DNA-binding transcriptional regulator, AcrR family n=1 Tax=Brevibacterium siliguriense TaxID=1136497 RepID=A0A1H1N039_9MICO|nr:TetR/AcrR family transcriptional regulator [Brevibacterium siliguriense]SDR92270.1 DNA-binding transcriptional regulator, AcrR family [Brevibacterium siliguriense]